MSNVRHWDDFYKKPLEDIPWEISEPPGKLKELVENHSVKPGRALDIACGSGNYSIYMAEKGFDVTGIDFSDNAIGIAKARRPELGINFIVGDVLEMDRLLPAENFDFILDYSLLHHINPDHAKKYAAQVIRTLKPGGKLLLVCYSEKHKRAKGKDQASGKYGNAMYFRTREEIAGLYEDLDQTLYKPARLGKGGKHPAHCFLFEKP